MGYNTLDLVMLVIAAFVIWVASRVPQKGAVPQKRGLLARLRRRSHRHSGSLSLK